jgi:hypothetical protein
VLPILGVGVLSLGLALATFLWFGGAEEVPHVYALAPESALPAKIRQAPRGVKDAYRFAIANRGVLQQIPCFCGCGTDGHKNNADCYIRAVKPDGQVVFDYMSYGWGICVDITRDVMRMLDAGSPLKDIRAYVDRTYSRFGPSTATPSVL